MAHGNVKRPVCLSWNASGGNKDGIHADSHSAHLQSACTRHVTVTLLTRVDCIWVRIDRAGTSRDECLQEGRFVSKAESSLRQPAQLGERLFRR